MHRGSFSRLSQICSTNCAVVDIYQLNFFTTYASIKLLVQLVQRVGPYCRRNRIANRNEAAEFSSVAQRAASSEPLVVHACSTTTHPQTLYRWWHMSHVYWAANPAPVQFNWKYPSMEVRVPPVGLPSTGFLYRLYSLLGDIKFWLISFLLHLLGRVDYAQRLWLGWLV